VCHVREAEEQAGPAAAAGLRLPLLLASSVVANSKATAAWVAAGHRRLAGPAVIYNGFAPAVHATPEPVGGPPRLLVVGRLSPRKGQDVAVDALDRLVRAGYDAHLDVAGTPFRGYEWFERALRRRVDTLGLADRVVFHGFVDPPWPLLRAATVALVPSRVEPFGNVVVEAQHAGRAVVASAVGGIPEIAEDAGMLVPPDDPDALAGAVARLLDDPALRAACVDGGLRSVERFGLDRYRRQLADLVAVTAGVFPACGTRTPEPERPQNAQRQ
jgi:glycosyltransferase involved in cell wall biosynthesis